MFIAGTSTRRDCFHLTILDDATTEDDEYLFLDLYLDTVFGIQEETRIILNSTRVTILGKSYNVDPKQTKVEIQDNPS